MTSIPCEFPCAAMGDMAHPFETSTSLAGEAGRGLPVASHPPCRLGKCYDEGEGRDCFSRLGGYKEIEPPHIEVHRDGIEALKAKRAGELSAMLRHVASMERASMKVLENLQKMADGAVDNPDILCDHH